MNHDLGHFDCLAYHLLEECKDVKHAAISSAHNSRRCTGCEANSYGFCAEIGDDVRSLLTARGFRTDYGLGDELIAQNLTIDKIGIIATGLVKVCMITEDGDEFVLQVLGAGQIVGEIGRSETAFSWEAATPVGICWIPLSVLDGLMRDFPAIYRALLAMTSQQLEDMRLWAAAMRGRNTLQRIAYWLLVNIDDADVAEKPIIKIALTRRDLASFLDMTSETLCRGLSQLAGRRAVRLRAVDLIELTDVTKLRLFARCPDNRVSATLASYNVATTLPRRLGSTGSRTAVSHTSQSGGLKPGTSARPGYRPALSADNAPPELS